MIPFLLYLGKGLHFWPPQFRNLGPKSVWLGRFIFRFSSRVRRKVAKLKRFGTFSIKSRRSKIWKSFSVLFLLLLLLRRHVRHTSSCRWVGWERLVIIREPNACCLQSSLEPLKILEWRRQDKRLFGYNKEQQLRGFILRPAGLRYSAFGGI